jgi:hypothetical protein
MMQQGRVFALATRGRDGKRHWAFRYRTAGRASKRVQRGGFRSEEDARAALARALEKLRRERGGEEVQPRRVQGRLLTPPAGWPARWVRELPARLGRGDPGALSGRCADRSRPARPPLPFEEGVDELALPLALDELVLDEVRLPAHAQPLEHPFRGRVSGLKPADHAM